MHAPEQFSAPYADLPVTLANFLGMIANIDQNVGRLRSFLDQQGLTENTIFIFTTDNGTSSGHAVFNARMRGNKGSEYDGGHRVPFFIHWPAGGLTGPRDVTPITAHVDVLPTLIDLCGILPPLEVKFDGRSLRELLVGAEPADGDWDERILVTDSQRVKDPIKWRKSAVMSSRWRLVNGQELYDMQADPGQQRNVAADHPQVAARLADFYEAWWSELEPTFRQDAAIYLGHPRDNPACLTAHDWITTESTPWNQGAVRSALAGAANTGFWNVEVADAGDYEIRLRRWPREIDAALDAALPPGADVPGQRAFRARPGLSVPIVGAAIDVAGQTSAMTVKPGAKEAVFRLQLPAGRARLAARFQTAEGEEIGAYYAYVERL
jgi:arylsulfatase B